MPKYQGDPRWISARFPSTCRCGKRINKGDEILWYPGKKYVLCQTCGSPEWAAFKAAAWDEEQYNLQYGPRY